MVPYKDAALRARSRLMSVVLSLNGHTFFQSFSCLAVLLLQDEVLLCLLHGRCGSSCFTEQQVK